MRAAIVGPMDFLSAGTALESSAPTASPPLLAGPDGPSVVSLTDSGLTWLATNGVRIVVILLVAAIASWLMNWAVKRLVRGMIGSTAAITSVATVVVKREQRAARIAQARRAQRAETLSNVARNVARAVIWLIAIVMVLSELGVNVAPVIASLGVIGLAAGIGAQTIIKDIVAGVVMLFEDVIAVGDIVDLEYATGTVEEINLRVTQVRSLDGVLWTVRNGEIVRVGNMSRGFSTALVMLDIDAEADNTKVSEVLARIGNEFERDPDWTDDLEGDVVISGILRVDGARFQRRVTVKVSPGKQWSVEQELRRRIRVAFQKEGIDFALPRFSETQQS